MTTELKPMTAGMSWDQIHKYGVCVIVRSHMWGGRKKLDRYDIGLQFSDEEWKEASDKFSLGVKYLTEPARLSEMKGVINKARAIPLKYGVAFGDLVGVTFVPTVAYDDMKLELDELRVRFYELKKTFLSEYDVEQDKWLISYRQYAHDTLYGLLPVNEMTRDEFADNFIEKLQELIPTAKDLDIKFALIWKTFELGNPSEVEEDSGAAQFARNKIVRDMKAQMDGQINSFMDGLFESVRGELMEVVQNSLEVVEHGRFTEKTISAVLEKVQKLKGLNFYQDETLAASLGKLEGACSEHSRSGLGKEEFKTLFKDSLSSVTRDIKNSQASKKGILDSFKSGGRKIKY